MAKGIIVLDEIPGNCRNIRGDENSCLYGGMVCQITGIDVMEHVIKGTKPDWCPIKKIPERLEELKQPHSINDYQRKGFSKGFNTCIDEIEGSAEK